MLSPENVMRPDEIKIYKKEDLIPMRRACQLAKRVLDHVEPYVDCGITTEELDKICHDFIISHNAVPAPLNYNGYPKSVCTSVNNVICHGIPSEYKLKNGDIINIDVTVILDGWFGDTSKTYGVGTITSQAQRLIDITKESLDLGIEAVQIGGHFGDIGQAIQSFVEKRGFSVVRDYCGHGIGRVFHDNPAVLHYGERNTGHEILPGMFFTIEPMINEGSYKTKLLKDGWTAVTVDKSLSAQFEHTIAVTEEGVFVLTDEENYL